MKGELIHAYLDYNVVDIEQLTGIVSLTNETSGKSIYVADCTHRINKSTLYSGNSDVNRISEKKNS
jgi:hypothetical protein